MAVQPHRYIAWLLMYSGVLWRFQRETSHFTDISPLLIAHYYFLRRYARYKYQNSGVSGAIACICTAARETSEIAALHDIFRTAISPSRLSVTIKIPGMVGEQSNLEM